MMLGILTSISPSVWFVLSFIVSSCHTCDKGPANHNERALLCVFFRSRKIGVLAQLAMKDDYNLRPFLSRRKKTWPSPD